MSRGAFFARTKASLDIRPGALHMQCSVKSLLKGDKRHQAAAVSRKSAITISTALVDFNSIFKQLTSMFAEIFFLTVMY